MGPDSNVNANKDQTQATQPVQHISHAYELLKKLNEKFGLEKHPELQEAITRLELALNDLTVNTGGMF
jgi:hypothetical protein